MNQPAHDQPNTAESAPGTRERNVVGNWSLATAISSVVLPIGVMIVGTQHTRGFGVLSVVGWGFMLATVLSCIATLLGALGLYRVEQGRRSAITAAVGLGLGLLVLTPLLVSMITEGW